MKAGTRNLLLLVLAVVALPSWFIFRTYIKAGEFTTLVPRFDGVCAPIEGLVGAEDILADREAGRAFAIGHDRRAYKAGEDVRGYVRAMAFPSAELEPLADMTRGKPAEFAPLGADLFIDEVGVRRLLVANRAAGQGSLEVFRVDGEGLTHELTLTDPLMINPNDVVALGPSKAYVTLDKKSKTGSIGEVIEGALERKTGKVLYIDQNGARVVAEGLVYANGIAMGQDAEFVYVAETVARAVSVFRRDTKTNDLKLADRVPVGTGVDNITVDAEGRLWIAAHPKLLTFVGYAKSPEKTTPSQVILLDPKQKQGDQVYITNDGSFSGASVAVPDVEARRMVLGSVYNADSLACDLPEVWRHSESYPASRPIARDGIGG